MLRLSRLLRLLVLVLSCLLFGSVSVGSDHLLHHLTIQYLYVSQHCSYRLTITTLRRNVSPLVRLVLVVLVDESKRNQRIDIHQLQLSTSCRN